MKHLILFLTALGAGFPVPAPGQGSLFFANRAAEIRLDAPVLSPGGDPNRDLMWATLAVGSAPDRLERRWDPVFYPGAYWIGVSYVLPEAAPGSTVYVQVQTWHAAAPGYEQAVAANLYHGVSDVLPVVLGGDTRGGTQPPSFPAYLSELKPIVLQGVPEPSAPWLALVGLAVLSSCRRWTRSR